jgi:hypothetical protein
MHGRAGLPGCTRPSRRRPRPTSTRARPRRQRRRQGVPAAPFSGLVEARPRRAPGKVRTLSLVRASHHGSRTRLGSVPPVRRSGGALLPFQSSSLLARRRATPILVGTEWEHSSDPAPSWPVPQCPARSQLTSTNRQRSLAASTDNGQAGFLIICRSWVRAPPAPPSLTCGGAVTGKL